MGQVNFEKWNLEFEVPEGWEPRIPWCRNSCPVSILVPLDEVCPGMKPSDICPIERRARKNGV